LAFTQAPRILPKPNLPPRFNAYSVQRTLGYQRAKVKPRGGRYYGPKIGHSPHADKTILRVN